MAITFINIVFHLFCLVKTHRFYSDKLKTLNFEARERRDQELCVLADKYEKNLNKPGRNS